MKCKVCGFQIEGDRSYCPMCGARVNDSEILPGELQWNTKDFPQPKDVKDIPMRWSSPDATEGYLTMPSEREKREAAEKELVVETPVQAVPIQAVPEQVAPVQEELIKEPPVQETPAQTFTLQDLIPEVSKPVVEEPKAPVTPINPNTFSDDSNEFQLQLEKEFERLRDTKNQEELEPSPRFAAPAGFGPAFETARTKSSSYPSRNTGAFIDLPEQQVSARVNSKGARQDRFDIDAIEDTIEEIVAAEAKAQAESSERQRKLAAMAAARDAYFRSLDDGEFDSILNKKKNPKYDPKQQSTTYAPTQSVQTTRTVQASQSEQYTQPVQAFQTASKPAERPVLKYTYTDPTPETPNLSELAGKLQDNTEHTMRFEKQGFILAEEKERKRIAEAQAEAERKRLAEEQAEAERKRIAEEQAEAERKRIAEEAAVAMRMAQEEAERKRIAEEQAEAERKRLAEEQAEAERKRIAEEQAEAERKRLAEEQAEAERKRIAEETAAAMRMAQEEAERKRLAEEKAEAERKRIAEEQAEAERKRIAEEQAEAERKAKEEERKHFVTAQAEADRKRIEEAQAEAQRKAKEEAERKALEEVKRIEQEKAEAERKRIADEEAEAQRKAQEETELKSRDEARASIEKARLDKLAERYRQEARLANGLVQDKNEGGELFTGKDTIQESLENKKNEISTDKVQANAGSSFESIFTESGDVGKSIQDEITAALSIGKSNPKVSSVEETDMFEKKPVEDHPLFTLKAETDAKDLASERKENANMENISKNDSISFTPAAPAKHDPEEIDDLYGDDDDDDDVKVRNKGAKKGKKHHVIPTILLSIIILVGLIELAIFLLGKFMPEKSFVKTAIEVNSAVIETVISYCEEAWDVISKWVDGAIARVQELFKGN